MLPWRWCNMWQPPGTRDAQGHNFYLGVLISLHLPTCCLHRGKIQPKMKINQKCTVQHKLLYFCFILPPCCKQPHLDAPQQARTNVSLKPQLYTFQMKHTEGWCFSSPQGPQVQWGSVSQIEMAADHVGRRCRNDMMLETASEAKRAIPMKNIYFQG